MSNHKRHAYSVRVDWTGNCGTGTSSYRAYARDHEISAHGKQPIQGSSDSAFRGNPARYNPEELLVSSVSSCHMLWYLHLCADSGVVVLDYSDHATGTMVETPDGSGSFHEVTLRPRVSIAAASNAEIARQLHERAHLFCFIANSVRFPVRCEPEILVARDETQGSQQAS
jgi:organic hydroperoxide reductase OsmC/OhrA